MKPMRLSLFLVSTVIAGCGLIPGLTSSDGPIITIKGETPTAISRWDEIATITANAPPTPSGSPAEQRPAVSEDIALVHIAIYDAVMAIERVYTPFAVTPAANASGASLDAAIGAAAYGVLSGLFPNRKSLYQAAYASHNAAIADGDAKRKGLALGAEVATRLIALRGDDGRMVALAPFVPGTTPGAFRGTDPVLRYFPSFKPYALKNSAQFRSPPPPALDSAVYARDVEETRLLGGAASKTRTAAQLEAARFHTERPSDIWPRNLRQFAMTKASTAEIARTMAMIYVALADSEIACLESKYHYLAWRPISAIALADTDGNPATDADPSWKPVLPTPPHPEYPAAHSCVSSALQGALQALYGTDRVRFGFDSKVTNTRHEYASAQDFVDETTIARIAGGMHFRCATEAGVRLGANVAKWVSENYFKPR